MTQTQRVLDYAPPASTGGFRRILTAVALSLAIIIACIILGGFVGHLVVKPFYLARGVLWVQMAPSQNNSPPASPMQPLQAVVTTALSAARQSPSGLALPSSVSDALGNAAITVGRSNDLVSISFMASDPAAAACMANEMIKAYMRPLTMNRSGIYNPSFHYPAVRSVTLLETPTAGVPIRNAGFALGGITGAIAGLLLLICGIWFRRARTKMQE